MRTAYWDTSDPEMYFGNPNLRWGSPSYLLEPGDPGYIHPYSSVNQNKNKTKTMKKNSFYPMRQGDQIVWLGNVVSKLASHATALGLTPAQVTAILADCLWLIYILQFWLPATRKWSLSCTDALAEAQTGTGASAQVLPLFVPPPLPTGTVAVQPGALARIFNAVQSIKDSGKCTDAIGDDLGFFGSTATPPDLTNIQPVIDATISGHQVFIKWGWGGLGAYLDMIELQVDRNDGKGYVLLAYDTTPGYTDTAAFPAVKTIWTYRGIYHVGEAQVGIWSNAVSLAVNT
jgi:hypothetical protein